MIGRNHLTLKIFNPVAGHKRKYIGEQFLLGFTVPDHCVGREFIVKFPAQIKLFEALVVTVGVGVGSAGTLGLRK